MKKKIGIICYIVAFILIIMFFIKNIGNVYFNPTLRIASIITGSIIMGIGAKLINNDKLKKISFIIWFVLYIILLISLTLLDDLFYRGNKVLIFEQKFLDYYLKYYLNLHPFRMISDFIKAYLNGNLSLKYLLINIIGNLVMFIPFAFFLPRLFKKQKKFWVFFITVTFVIVSIELLQLITFSGTCDIDDYILNIVGASIGFIVFNNKRINKYIDKLLN